jgi:flagellar protein FlbD
MLEVTRLNGQKIVINCDLIEYIDANPDTTITLTTANKFVVKEGIEEVIDKIVKYKNKIYSQSIKINQNTKEEE